MHPLAKVTGQRNPKSEIRDPKEIRMSKSKEHRLLWSYSEFGFRPALRDFGLRFVAAEVTRRTIARAGRKIRLVTFGGYEALS